MITNPRTHEAYKLLHEGTLALARAEQHGIRIDLDYIQRKKIHITRRIARMEKLFYASKFYKRWEHSTQNKINIYSNSQLANYLYNTRKIEPIKFTESGQGATDKEALKQLNISELNDLLQIRKLKKIYDVLSLFEREQVRGVLHPFFNLHLVRTYRSSSDSPNFQNIFKRDEEAMQICRKALYPRKGNQLFEIDFSGIEVRISACYHKDESMIKYINNPNSDMHADIAKQLFFFDTIDKKTSYGNILRQAAKNGFVFPQFYGDYYKNCAVNITEWIKLSQTKWRKGEGIKLHEEGGGAIADHMIKNNIKNFNNFVEHVNKIEYDFWNNRFKEYNEWKNTWYNLYQKYGYFVMKTGFACSGIMSKNDVINYPVQGAAFHCLLWSLIEIDKILIKENWKTRIIGQIHDSIIFDIFPPELEYIKRIVKKITCVLLQKTWDWIIVPMDIEAEICEVDKSWAEKEKCLI